MENYEHKKQKKPIDLYDKIKIGIGILFGIIILIKAVPLLIKTIF